MNDIRISSVSNAYDAYRPAVSGRISRAEEHKDMVAISEKAKDFQTVRKALRNVPDAREDKVNTIKSRLASSQYNVTSSDIAAKLVGSYMN